MVKIRWNEEAIIDIDEIAGFIAEDSVFYAQIQVERFFERVDILKTTPTAGRKMPETNDEKIRELIEGNYRIIYQIKSNSEIEILCVIHGMRLLKNHRSFKLK
ncbi:MAG: type II toxin-antitoxin system RelE/ParE family toxin [Bacteroidetes bacterium]|nr:type II toxin-antitoxin system RelE/ParE family toxin [Bacteroidota bacterium]